jgi:hypothetical protein
MYNPFHNFISTDKKRLKDKQLKENILNAG